MTDEPGRVLGIDLGDARIGLALSDPLGWTAQPLETVQARGIRKDLTRICQVIEEREVTTVVVGYPLHLSGDAGERADAAREWARRLEARRPGLRVELWDERLTTAEAERSMIADDVSRSRRKRTIDQVAAALILQSWLDARESPR